MRHQILIVVVCLLFLSCKKNKNFIPTLKIKSISSTSVSHGGSLFFVLSFNNIMGSTQDSLFIQQITFNKFANSCIDTGFSEKVGVPLFTASTSAGGELTVSFANGVTIPGYIILSPKCNADDSSYFRFMLQDKYSHKSDTVKTGLIIVKAN